MSDMIIKEYCDVCGSLLVLSCSFYEYSRTSGKKEYMITGSCPNKRWWNDHRQEGLGYGNKEYIKAFFGIEVLE